VNAAAIADITIGYTHIKNVLLEARDIIELEYARLKTFNANPL